MRESVALGRMTLALTLALCKTRKYPLCTPRGAGVGHWCEVLTLRVTVDVDVDVDADVDVDVRYALR